MIFSVLLEERRRTSASLFRFTDFDLFVDRFPVGPRLIKTPTVQPQFVQKLGGGQIALQRVRPMRNTVILANRSTITERH